MGQEEAVSAGPVPSLSRRRGKTPKKRTGKVRPASASRAGAIRRANRAGADTGARGHAIRAKQGPRPGLEDGGAEGTKRDGGKAAATAEHDKT